MVVKPDRITIRIVKIAYYEAPLGVTDPEEAYRLAELADGSGALTYDVVYNDYTCYPIDWPETGVKNEQV